MSHRGSAGPSVIRKLESPASKETGDFYPKGPLLVPVYVTHKVAFRRKKPNSLGTDRFLGPEGEWAGNCGPHPGTGPSWT